MERQCSFALGMWCNGNDNDSLTLLEGTAMNELQFDLAARYKSTVSFVT